MRLHIWKRIAGNKRRRAVVLIIGWVEGREGSKAPTSQRVCILCEFGRPHISPRTMIPIEFIESSHHHNLCQQAREIAGIGQCEINGFERGSFLLLTSRITNSNILRT